MAGGFKYNVNRSKTDGPSKGGSSGGLAQLMALMAAQQKSSEGQQRNPDEITVGRTDPYTGERTITERGEDFEVRKAGRTRAMQDATQAIAALRKLMPVVDEYESEFRRVYPDAENMKGPMGKFHSAGKVFNAAIENDPQFKTALEQLQGKRAMVARGLGEVGNLAEREQAYAMQIFPEQKFGNPEDFFLPESPATGVEKIGKFRNFLEEQIGRNAGVINSGGDVMLEGMAGPQDDRLQKIEQIKARFKQRKP